jgi:MFS family permease
VSTSTSPARGEGPAGRPQREPTSWTLPLRRVSAAYLLLAALVQLLTNALFETRPAIERSLRASNPNLAGDQLHESVSVGYVSAWLLVAAVVAGAAVLAFGAYRGWRWAFWANLVVLLVGAAQLLTNAVALASPVTQIQPPAAIAVDLVLSLLAFGLLLWSIVAAARYGPWAMRRPGAA